MDAILRPSNARSSAAYIFVLARGAAICRGGVKQSIRNHRLSARYCRMVAQLQNEASKRGHFVRFVRARRIVPIVAEPPLALSQGCQSRGVAVSRTFKARQPR